MNEPLDPPEIPKGKLHASLAIPPLVTVLGVSAIATMADPDYFEMGALFVLLVHLVTIIICLFSFNAALRVRYHGRGVVLTSIAYFLGQVIIWFGCCLAVFRC